MSGQPSYFPQKELVASVTIRTQLSDDFDGPASPLGARAVAGRSGVLASWEPWLRFVAIIARHILDISFGNIQGGLIIRVIQPMMEISSVFSQASIALWIIFFMAH